MNSTPEFKHRLAAHCESGVVASILNHSGIDISEAMVFGISGAIFFAYLDTPMMTFPAIAVRNQPGKIRANVTRYLGAEFQIRKYWNQEKARDELDELVERGIPVVVQVDFFYMDYVPRYARAHFNGHFVIIIGKNERNYIISDAYAPQLVELNKDTLMEARFVAGSFKPKGLMFYSKNNQADLNFEKAICKGIKHAAFYMLRLPVPFLGVKGIRRFAEKLPDWPRHTRDLEHLSHEVMMTSIILEDRGTGGGGFRFMYAAFLQEAAKLLNKSSLGEIAEQMMDNGDEWRRISLFAGRIGRNRDLGSDRLKELSNLINKRADVERKLFSDLLKAIKN